MHEREIDLRDDEWKEHAECDIPEGDCHTCLLKAYRYMKWRSQLLLVENNVLRHSLRLVHTANRRYRKQLNVIRRGLRRYEQPPK